MTQNAPQHEPVLVEPLLRLLDPRPGDVVLDGTVGLGGHALAILPQIVPGGRYVGLDIDPEMVALASERLGAAGGHASVRLEVADYSAFDDVLTRLGIQAVDRILLDLGVNSAQIDNPARGFAFDQDGPLDMRFDPRRQKQNAADLVNSLSEGELADLFYEYGQEPHARKIARRICQVRHHGRIATTRALAAAVESAIRAAGYEGRGGAPLAARVFQALRIAVNRELEALEAFLGLVAAWLRPGGRLAVIAFHSLEDGMVKRFLRNAQRAGTMREVTTRPVIADARERGANPRCRSAKLRVAQRVEDAASQRT